VVGLVVGLFEQPIENSEAIAIASIFLKAKYLLNSKEQK